METYDEGQVQAFNAEVTACYREARREPDAQYPTWIARLVWDAGRGGLSWAESRAKHLAELRQALGLEPGPAPTPQPAKFDPHVRQPWPRPMPPDIDTTDLLEVTDRVDWCLQANNCNDPRSLWVGYVMDIKGEGHAKGWTATGYWRTNKMAFAEGNGKGYVWPPE